MAIMTLQQLTSLANTWKSVEPGATAYDVVYRENKLRLLHFPATNGKHNKPLLIVYSVINKYTILDLVEGKSVVAWLNDRGFDVFMIDWGTAGPEDRHFDMDYYCDHLLGRCVRKVKAIAGTGAVPVLGYCIGGTMTAVYAAVHPEDIKALVLLAAPVDFEKGGALSQWTKPGNFNPDAIIDAFGNLPPEYMQSAFTGMNLAAQGAKLKTVAEKSDDHQFLKFFVAMEKWSNDNVPYPGAFYRRYIREWYQENRLMAGTFMLGSRKVQLEDIRCPVCVVTASKDTIVPPECAEAILGLVSSEEKRSLRFEAGHIGISVGGKAFADVWPAVASFLDSH